MRITKDFINGLEPTRRQEYADDEVPGLRLRVSSKGAKDWSVLVTVDGSRKRITIGSAAIISPRQAREKGRQLAAQAKLGLTPKKKRRTGHTIKSLADAYQKSREWGRYAASTKRNWQGYLSHILPHFGDRDPASITRDDVRRWGGEVAEEKPIAANRSFSALKRLYNWSIDGGLISGANPVSRLPKPTEETHRERVYTNDELQRALEATSGTDVEVLFRLIMFTLLRSGEARAIRLSWLDWQHNVLTVPASVAKGRRDHPVPLPSHAAFLLRGVGGIHTDTPVDRAKRLAPKGGDPALFPAGTKEGYMVFPTACRMTEMVSPSEMPTTRPEKVSADARGTRSGTLAKRSRRVRRIPCASVRRRVTPGSSAARTASS